MKWLGCAAGFVVGLFTPHRHRWAAPIHHPMLTIQHCEDFCGAHRATLYPSMLSNECSGGFRCSMGLDGAHEIAASREKYEEWVRKEQESKLRIEELRALYAPPKMLWPAEDADRRFDGIDFVDDQPGV